MENTKIHELVSEKNREYERLALRDAEHIIEQIAKQQDNIVGAQARIVELRAELKELEVKQMSAKAILGEE